MRRLLVLMFAAAMPLAVAAQDSASPKGPAAGATPSEAPAPLPLIVPKPVETHVVSYSLAGEMYDQQIHATVDGRNYVAFVPDMGLSTIAFQADLDGDGYDELVHGWIGGGNCCPTTFSVLSYRGNGIFSNVTHADFWSWGTPELIETGAEPRLRVESIVSGAGHTSDEVTLSVFAYRDGALHLVEQAVSDAHLPALVELKAGDFDRTGTPKSERLEMSFDMNADGRADVFSCGWWERWGALSCDIRMGGGGVIEIHTGCERIGVLDSRTGGMNDLVCGRDGVLTFNGTAYASF
ncbi:hypothetical protein [Psychromarinibacter sp. S121]|uniref:hypothetical protein n=1 Tax=Psychromarinibacter sp. S121 TaxID=3415127 RepID=UPI003C7BBA9D